MKIRRVLWLLALAGSGSIVLAESSGVHGTERLSGPARIHSRTWVRHDYARSVSREHGPASTPRSVAPAKAPAAAVGSRQTMFRQTATARFSIPMTFEPNVGQMDPGVRFVGRGRGLTVFLTNTEIAVRVAANSRAPSRTPDDVVRLRLAGSAGLIWRGEGKLQAESNYFIGRDSRAWRTRVPHFAGARAANAARGVSVVVYGNDDGVEYDVRVAPGADVSQLRLRISGATKMQLASGGDLMLVAGETELRMKRPAFYEERQRGRRRRVAGGYVLHADGSVGFHVGPHDAGATLVVDPSISYATFLGGTGTDSAASIAVDQSGKVYVGGTTTSASTFPETAKAWLGPAGGPAQFFIAKIDPAVTGPNSLLYLTFVGGSGTQTGGLIAVDSSGNAAITGTTTSADFPVTDGSTPAGGPNSTTVSEIDPTGSHLVFSTFFGGSGAESEVGPGGIAIDASGNVYIASETGSGPGTSSPGLPVTPNSLQTSWDGMRSDGFLAIFQPPASPGGAALLKYCSYLGTNSSGLVSIGGIALDRFGNAYIAGLTNNAIQGFPAKNAFQPAYGGGVSDAFLMKISPKGQGSIDLVYATLLGGSGADKALAVAVDSGSPANAYVTGATESADFPVHGATAGYQTSRASAAADAFLAVIAQNGATGATSLAYATYLGGSTADAGQGVAVTAPTAVYITGATTSWDFPWRDNVQPFNGAGDAFLAKLNPTLSGLPSLVYATPLGGTSPSGGTATATSNAVATDGAGHVYVAGATTSADFPTAVTTQGAVNGLQQSCASCQQTPATTDAFVVAIQENSTTPEPSVYFNLGKVSFPLAPVGAQGVPQPVAVLNGGEAPLHISGIAITGPNADDFFLSGVGACIGTSISPGSTPACSFEVNFAPRVAGIEAAVVTVTDDAPGSPQVLELTGAGGAPLTVAPTSLNFGSVPQGAASPTQTLTLTNAASNSIQGINIVVSGPDASQFPPTLSCTSIPAGGSCLLGFRFQPSATGTFHAEVDLSYQSGDGSQAQQTIPLTGVGTAAAPVASVTPQAVSFPNQATGTASSPQTITLTNVGSAPLNLTSIAITGTQPGDFSIGAANTTCPLASGTLNFGNPHPSCTVAVRFTPQATGNRSARLSFSDNASDSPQEIALTGTATAPPATLQVSPANIIFAAQSEGTASASQNATITNPGSTAADISGIKLSGPNASDFVLGNSCAPSLVAGGTCQLQLSFKPVVATPPGGRLATLNIPGGDPSTVPLSGTATQAAISTPTSFDFGNQLAGTPASSITPQPLTVTNSSTGPFAGALAVAGVSVSGANPGDFVVGTDACISSTTPPSGTCTVQVTFAPAQTPSCGSGSARSATLVLQDNAPGSPHTILLRGTATDFCFNSPSGQPVSAPVSPGQTATYTLEIDSFAGFAGSIGLACSDPVPASGCAVTTTPATTPPSVQISPGTPGQFTVSVTTTAATPSRFVKWPTGSPARRQVPRTIVAMLLAILALLAAWLAGSRAARPGRHASNWARLVQAGALLVTLGIGMAACGGGSGGDPSAAPPGTPRGTYTVTVKATAANGVSHTTSLTLIVQ